MGATDLWWVPAYIALGSNLDDPVRQVLTAAARLGELPRTRLVRTSPLYRSPPLDGSAQPDYVNAVAAVLTGLPPRDLLARLLALEDALGRVRSGDRFAARIIDLDLLMSGEDVIDEPGLRVPHYGLHRRAFVLRPLADVAPDIRVPGRGRVSDLLAAVDTSMLIRLPGTAQDER